MIIKSVLAVTASSLNTCGCIPSGPTDLSMVSLFPYSTLLHIAPHFPTDLVGPGFLKAGLISKDWGNRGTEYPGLLHIICHLIPMPFSSSPTFSLLFLLLLISLQKACLLHFMSFDRLGSRWVLAFPSPRSELSLFPLGHLAPIYVSILCICQFVHLCRFHTTFVLL